MFVVVQIPGDPFGAAAVPSYWKTQVLTKTTAGVWQVSNNKTNQYYQLDNGNSFKC